MKTITKKPDKEWVEILNKKGFTKKYPFKNKSLEDLKQKLLSEGGWAVILPEDEFDIDQIVERGFFSDGKSKLIKGEPCRCHSNSALLWHKDKKRKICTGYALSDDGVWRSHTWCVVDKTKIIETTIKRIKYYGYILSRVESAFFLMQNNNGEEILND
jgi:hypothetical protein